MFVEVLVASALTALNYGLGFAVNYINLEDNIKAVLPAQLKTIDPDVFLVVIAVVACWSMASLSSTAAGARNTYGIKVFIIIIIIFNLLIVEFCFFNFFFFFFFDFLFF